MRRRVQNLHRILQLERVTKTAPRTAETEIELVWHDEAARAAYVTLA